MASLEVIKNVMEKKSQDESKTWVSYWKFKYGQPIWSPSHTSWISAPNRCSRRCRDHGGSVILKKGETYNLGMATEQTLPKVLEVGTQMWYVIQFVYPDNFVVKIKHPITYPLSIWLRKLHIVEPPNPQAQPPQIWASKGIEPEAHGPQNTSQTRSKVTGTN